MEVFVLAGLGAVSVALVIYALLPKKGDQDDAIKRRTAGLRPDQDLNVLRSKAKQKATAGMFAKAAPLLSRPVMPKDAAEQTNIRGKLATAGFRNESATTFFLASKTGFAVLGLAVGIFMGINAGKPFTHVIGQAFIGAALGFMLPSLWLNIKMGRRKEAITHGMPDSLDLMVVGVEAGLGLDAALLRVGDEMRNVHMDLADEFQIVSVETQMGVPRAEALERMATRCGVPAMKSLVAVICQAEKLGTSVARALRTQSDTLRTKRRQKAEERAQKTPVKLLLPLILFIFPSIFVVLAGPAAIQLMKTFGSEMPQ